MSDHSNNPRLSFLGLLTRKERWGVSWRGWLVAVIFLGVLGRQLFFAVYPFLATTHRVDPDILVVEGWIHDYAIRAAVVEFRAHPYRCIFTIGGPPQGSGGYTNVHNTAASVAADRLFAMGIQQRYLRVVPSKAIDRDRTYNSAVSLRTWLRDNHYPIRSINIVTEDVHARRSRLLFNKAFGKDIDIGIVAVPNPDYDSSRWWQFSEGVRETIGESIAYIYARFFFYRSDPELAESSAP